MLPLKSELDCGTVFEPNTDSITRSTDSGLSLKESVIINGYAGMVGTTLGMLNTDMCEVTTVETAEGEVIAMVRPCFAHSP